MRSIRRRDLRGSVGRMDGMKRLALVLVLAAAVLPASAPAAGCTPMDCAPSGLALGHGLFAVRPLGLTGPSTVFDLRSGHVRYQLPNGVLNGGLLVHQDGGQLTWWNALTHRRLRSATAAGYLVGSSQDGRRAVLSTSTKKQTTFVIATPDAQRTVVLPTQNWGFDALADGNLYLLRYLRNGYQVRRYDLAADRLDPHPLKDPHESALIWGSPWERVTSPDGRYVFTLYVGQNGGAMVHELDVRRAVARCIDLPGTGDFNKGTSYAMQLSPDARTLWAVSPGYGRVVGIDVASRTVRTAFRFKPAWQVESPSAAVAAISPRGDRLAVALATDIYVIAPATHAVVHWNRAAGALAFSPDGTRLWFAHRTVLRALRVDG
jgi:hypothetical protein